MARGKRPSRKSHHAHDSDHLNITPFIDILVCLILFLLSSASVLKLAVVDTQLPQLAEATTFQPPKKDDKEQLVVSLQILETGFRVGRVGRDSNAEKQRYWNDGGALQRMIPRKKDGAYDFDDLNRHMVRIKRTFPDAVSVLLLPSEGILYETIVGAMDASRETAEGERRSLLFPDAVIGHLAESGGGSPS